MRWFCVSTNAMCLLPTYVTYKRKLIGETVFTLSTGISSILYHGMELYDWKIHSTAIRNTDVILSFLLICHIAHYLTVFPHRWDATISILPIVIFACEVDIIYRLVGISCYAAVAITYFCTRKHTYDTGIFAVGILCAAGDVAFFVLGNRGYYSILHGMHHICIFMTQACVLYAYHPTVSHPIASARTYEEDRSTTRAVCIPAPPRG